MGVPLQEVEMPSLLIKKLPEEIHKKLKASALRNRRSVTQETIVILQEHLETPKAVEFPKPWKLSEPRRQRDLPDGIRRGRA